MATIKISVIIPTYNRKDLLKKCLLTLLAQTYPKEKFEIIIVDDGSTDTTESFIKKLQKWSPTASKPWRPAIRNSVGRNPAPSRRTSGLVRGKNPNLRFLKQSHDGVVKARNLGIKNARGEIIAFTDDDCLAKEKWLEEIDKAFNKNPKALGIEGKTLTYPTKVTPFTAQIVNTQGGGYQTCNIAYKKEVLKKLGGLDEKFLSPHCDDVDLALRVLKYGPIRFEPKAIVIHPPIKTTFKRELARVHRTPAEFYLFLRHPDYFKEKYGKKNLFYQVIFKNSIWIRLFHLKFYSPWIKKNPWLYLKFLFRTMLEIALIILSIPQLYLSYTKLKQFVSSSVASFPSIQHPYA